MSKLYFDIGANSGSWTSSNINSVDKIIAVEASPSTFILLKNNHYNNSKVTCLNYAVCKSKEEKYDEEFVDFHESTSHFLSTLNKDWIDSPNSRFNNHQKETIKVKRISLDNLINQYGTPDLLKIDVEGGEYHVISSLTTKVPLLCFEWASETNEITYKCLEHLLALGFKDFYVQDCDTYTFRPSQFYGIDMVKNNLMNSTPKVDWGMIWCK